MVNLDVLNTILLSFHPANKIKQLDLSDYTREGLAELQKYHDLIHLDTYRGPDGYGRRSDPNSFHFHCCTGMRGHLGAITRTCLCG